MNLSPENAYKLGKTLFPEEADPLPLVLSWYEQYENLKKEAGKTSAPLSGTGQRITSKILPSSDGSSLNLQLSEDDESIQKMMVQLRQHVKTSGTSVASLVPIIGVSYPTLNNWIKSGKNPRGESIGKIRKYLDDVKPAQ
jgi:hypothetical protein